MKEEMKVTREISLTLDQWEKLKEALDYYEYGAKQYLGYREGQSFREKFILPIYEQMPDEVF